MDTKSRIQRALLLERMARFPDHSRALGLKDRSSFHGAPVSSPASTGAIPTQKKEI